MNQSHNGRWVSYLRVSTKKQGESGLGLEAQRAMIQQHLDGGRWRLVEEVQEIESGRKTDHERPQLAHALKLCRIYNARLIIAKLDRLARNVAFISRLMESGVDFEACDIPSANRFTVHVLAAVAEQEALAISQRTKAALAALKARGVKLGNPRSEIAKYGAQGRRASLNIRRAIARKRALDLHDAIEELRAAGTTRPTAIARAFNQREMPTPRGRGQWRATQVQRVINVIKSSGVRGEEGDKRGGDPLEIQFLADHPRQTEDAGTEQK
jgi:DNA invertase Pin-like site-specific DNA recombinase